MKFSAQEEYGLRCLLSIGREYGNRGLTIPEISETERISQHNVAKLLRILRLGGFLESERGQSGGYTLSDKPENILIGDVLSVLGGRLFDDSFCRSHAGTVTICTNTSDCSVRSLWRILQDAVDKVLENLTLNDLLKSENEFFSLVSSNIENI